MGLTSEQKRQILDLGGAPMLAAAEAADARAVTDTKALEESGIAWKSVGGSASARKATPEEVQRVADLLSLTDELKLRREHVVTLINDIGLDKAERVLVILADGSAEAAGAASRKQRTVPLIDQLTTVKSSLAGGSYLDQLLGVK